MHKKRLFAVSLGLFLALSVTAASAETVVWHFDDHQMHHEMQNNTTSNTTVVAESSSTPPTVTYYHPHPMNASEQLKLRSLFQEHAALTADTLIARFDNAPQFDAAQESLTNNSRRIEQEIGSMYGSDVQNQFTTLWQQHIDQYLRYTDGLKGDTAMKDDAKAQLDTSIEQLASLFDNKTGSSHADLVDLFKNHVYFTRQIIEMHAAQNYRMQFEYAHAGFEHAAAMSDALVTSTQ